MEKRNKLDASFSACGDGPSPCWFPANVHQNISCLVLDVLDLPLLEQIPRHVQAMTCVRPMEAMPGRDEATSSSRRCCHHAKTKQDIVCLKPPSHSMEMPAGVTSLHHTSCQQTTNGPVVNLPSFACYPCPCPCPCSLYLPKKF